MLNRTQAPEFKQIEAIHFIEPEAKELSNGIKVFTINAGEQDLVRIEFIFQNVNWNQKHPLQALTVNHLINNGTSALTAKEIAENIDFYGAFLQTEYAADYITVTLYSLNKHLSSVLPVVRAILNDSVFPQTEIDIYIQNQQQKLSVNLQKNDFIARRTFANTIFGDTPYGALTQEDDYNELTRAELIAYFAAAFKPENCTIIAAGKLGETEFTLLDHILGGKWNNHADATLNQFTYHPKMGNEIYIEKADSLQAALRMGNLSINRTNPDFAALQVLNCVFGGYFGSRLMTNIREEKGYTYGIGSGIAALKDAGYLFIATEVGTAVRNSAMQEIENEIYRLRNELIPEEELDLVRNYMLGSLLGSLENAFSHADKFKNIYFSGLDYRYYQNYINTVKTINNHELKNIATQYLNWEAMTKVVVG